MHISPEMHKGFEIGAETDPQDAAEIGRRGAADLMDHRDPGDHDADPLGAHARFNRRTVGGTPAIQSSP